MPTPQAHSMRLDFDKIRADNPLPEAISRSGIDLKKNGSEYIACCPFHADKTPSFTVFHGKAGWHYMCFGCGANGDVIDFVKDHYGLASAGEAGRWLTGEDQNRSANPVQRFSAPKDPYSGYSIIKPPAGAPAMIAGQRTPAILNPKRGRSVTYTPNMIFPYRNRRGELLGYVIRVEFEDRKITPGVWWTRGNGFEGWSHGSYPSPRPLYGLKELYERPNAQVLLVEGEKCADAANEVMRNAGRNVVAVSWMGGGKATGRTYWKSLAGRSVVIWPDADEEGAETAKALLKHCRDAGVRQIKIIDVSDRSEGWDIADAAEEWTPTQICEFIKERVSDGKLRGKNTENNGNIHENDRGATLGRKRTNGKGNCSIIGASFPGQTEEVGTDNASEGDKADNPIKRGSGNEQDDLGSRKRPPRENNASFNKSLNGSGRDISGRSEEGGIDDGYREAGTGSNAGLPRSISNEADGRHGAQGRNTGSNHSVPRENHFNGAEGNSISELNWRNHLIMNEKGEGLKSTSGQNAALILQYEKNFAGLFAWDDFAHNVLLMRRPMWDVNPESKFPRHLKDSDTTACCGWLEYAGLSVKFNDVGRIIVRVAEHNRFNPVKDALERLKWDGISRINGYRSDEGDSVLPFFAEYFGAENTEINRLFGEKWLIGAVARAMQPGCKMDTMIVLEGPQGLQKSTSLQALSDGLVKGVFTDEMSDPNSKDAALQMQGRWIIEIAELDSFSKATVTGIKSWLARSVDRFRRPYGKVVEEFPRSCVMAGTVNPMGNAGYLKDPTGGRRFWPVETTYIDIDRIKADAQQIWAEALHLYKHSVKWWLTREQDELATQAQKRRYEDDPWSEKIDGWCAGGNSVSLQSIMTNCLEIPAERQNILVTRRISSHMVRRGWERVDDNGRILYVRKGE